MIYIIFLIAAAADYGRFGGLVRDTKICLKLGIMILTGI